MIRPLRNGIRCLDSDSTLVSSTKTLNAGSLGQDLPGCTSDCPLQNNDYHRVSSTNNETHRTALNRSIPIHSLSCPALHRGWPLPGNCQQVLSLQNPYLPYLDRIDYPMARLFHLCFGLPVATLLPLVDAFPPTLHRLLHLL